MLNPAGTAGSDEAWRRGKPYAPDLRARVLSACDSGLGVREVARRLGVSPSYVVKVRKRRDATGETEARSRAGRPAPRLLAHEALLRARLAAEPRATLSDLRDWLAARHGIIASKTTIWRALGAIGLRGRDGCPASAVRGLTNARRG